MYTTDNEENLQTHMHATGHFLHETITVEQDNDQADENFDEYSAGSDSDSNNV